MTYTDALALTPSPEEALAQIIADYVRRSPGNRLHEVDASPIFDAPLVRYADGDDPLFENYKSIIGPFHLTPREVIAHAAEEQPQAAHRSLEYVSVICWVLPIVESTRHSNRAQSRQPSLRWAMTREFGERFNDALRDYVVTRLQLSGYLALAPMRSSLFKVQWNNQPNSPVSNWSERHVQYVAGQGTFGLSRGFITERGIAMRCGSVVTNLPLTPSERGYAYHYANCPYLAEGSCGACIDRCPAGAITADGMNKLRCLQYQREGFIELREQYPGYTLGCGLCQTGVPCEKGIPQNTKLQS